MPGGIDVKQSYGYDAWNRLETFQEAPWSGGVTALSEKYCYGEHRNRAVEAVSAMFPLNRVPAAGYDAAGGLAADHRSFMRRGAGLATCGAAVALGSCNALDTGGTWEARYVHDAHGKRVRRDTQVGGLVTTVVWEYDAGGKMVAEYGVGEGLGGVQYVTRDHLGSTRVVTDWGGVAVGLRATSGMRRRARTLAARLIFLGPVGGAEFPYRVLG